MSAVKEYWDTIGKSPNLNWEIAHVSEEDAFIMSGMSNAKRLFNSALSVIPDRGKILEIGCGRGRILKYLSAQKPDAEFIGVDVSKEMIDRAYLLPNVKYIVGNGADLRPFKNEYFDVVFSYIVFQHLPRRFTDAYVKEVARVLKKGGLFVFQMQTTTDKQKLDPPDDDFRKIRYYTIPQIYFLVEPMFRIAETDGMTNCENFITTAIKE